MCLIKDTERFFPASLSRSESNFELPTPTRIYFKTTKY